MDDKEDWGEIDNSMYPLSISQLLQYAYGKDERRQINAISLLCDKMQISPAMKMKWLQDVTNNSELIAQYFFMDLKNRAFNCSSNSLNRKQTLLHAEPTKVIDVFGIKMHSHIETQWKPEMVLNETCVVNLRHLAVGVLSNRPIIVQGSIGCGKSALIKELANAIGMNKNIIEIYINDQIDAKSLIGSYVCSEIPGEFVWENGLIVTAVIHGHWLIIEHIEKVPMDFIAMIADLLEHRRVYLPHTGRFITAHPSFRLFGIRSMNVEALQPLNPSSDANHQEHSSSINYNSLLYISNFQSFSHLFHFVSISNQTIPEIETALLSQFKRVPLELINKLIVTFQSYQVSNALDGSTFKLFTLREVFKVCRRIESYSDEINHVSGYITHHNTRQAFKEVLDVFASSIRDSNKYSDAVIKLGQIWNIAESDIEVFFLQASAHGTTESFIHRIHHTNDTQILKIGRAHLTTGMSTDSDGQGLEMNHHYVLTNLSIKMIEKVAVCIQMNEPVLLVGETGSGKTSVVQELASLLRKPLIVVNLSLSTDVNELFGGYKPVTIRQLMKPIYEEFVHIFQDTLSSSQNSEFLQVVGSYFNKSSWKKLLKAFVKACNNALQKLSIHTQSNEKRQKQLSVWSQFKRKVERLENNLPKIENSFGFSFVEGLLSKAMISGSWILLDEINLASPETLQVLAGVLDPFHSNTNTDESKSYQSDVMNPSNKEWFSRGQRRHPEFRILGAMNPPTDIGKRELPESMRCHFTEFYSEEMTNVEDLRNIVTQYLGGGSNTGMIVNTAPVDEIVQIYLQCRENASNYLIDSAGQKPHYSLRSLTRTLRASVKYFLELGLKPFRRSLFEAFILNFCTCLAESSRLSMWNYLRSNIYPTNSSNGELNFPPTKPRSKLSNTNDWILLKPFWLRTGKYLRTDWSKKDENGLIRYVMTPTAEKHVREIAAGIAAELAPILLQGPTSVGKTTMIEYLAALTGHKCVRINNHEHTDVQEYIGSYVTNAKGQLEFQDGLLVTALRNGDWIILDELNLASSEVLEALNRLLDDNRELLIIETGEIIRPAPGFQLFATQNPPGIYGGRKPLSRAFRNRFIELSIVEFQFTDIEEIVTHSCGIPPKFSKMLVQTMQELQIHRQTSTIFEGKNGIVTTRDLIKWGKRQPQTVLEVAEMGYMLIAEKMRKIEEKKEIELMLNKICKVNLNIDVLYGMKMDEEIISKSTDRFSVNQLQLLHTRIQNREVMVDGVQNIAVTKSLKRLWCLLGKCVAFNEPALIIGETGCGKTTICQLLAAHCNQTIRVLNCHQSTETADLIGGLRPVRGKEIIRIKVVGLIQNLVTEMKSIITMLQKSVYDGIQRLADAMNTIQSYQTMIGGPEDSDIDAIFKKSTGLLESIAAQSWSDQPTAVDNRKRSREEVTSIHQNERGKVGRDAIPTEQPVVQHLLENWRLLLHEAETEWTRYKSLFEWHDGPLITAMKNGEFLLIDEINLANDAVIERLNSVLESRREVTLAEKGGSIHTTDSDKSQQLIDDKLEKIVAHPNFKLFATMNPGGDFGKRELSPALRSRFTEIWVAANFDPKAKPKVEVDLCGNEVTACLSGEDEDYLLVICEVLHLNHLIFNGNNAEERVQNLQLLTRRVAQSMIAFIRWLSNHPMVLATDHFQMSTRDILNWAKFISQCKPTELKELSRSLIHGAYMIFLDGFGIGMTIPRDKINSLKSEAHEYLLNVFPEVSQLVNNLPESFFQSFTSSPMLQTNQQGTLSPQLFQEKRYSIGEFSIELGPSYQPKQFNENRYIMNAKITSINLGRILRSMQLSRPILLEGPPGVGKTSLISNLAEITGHKLIRINLSEHSELSDLLGNDLPSNSDDSDDHQNTDRPSQSSSLKFKWFDGSFLQAMKEGHWVLLDELNLAPQSVLEGLNACLDHRGQVFLPELGITVMCPPSFRVFCAQNPMVEGGGRKGLPQSFLSRFSRVYVEAMSEEDFNQIVQSSFGDVGVNNIGVHVSLQSNIPQMIRFVRQLQEEVVECGVFGSNGSPWEFNLRDIFRWCELIQYQYNDLTQIKNLAKYSTGLSIFLSHIISVTASIIFTDRFRSISDRVKVAQMYESIMGIELKLNEREIIRNIQDDKHLWIGDAKLAVNFNPRITSKNFPSGYLGAMDGLLEDSNVLDIKTTHLTRCVMHCINLKYPVLLVGEPGSGRRQMIQTLANLSGNHISYYSATTSTDATDLLGSFEQMSPIRQLRQFAQSLEKIIMRMVSWVRRIPLSFRNIQVLNKAVDLLSAIMKDYEVIVNDIENTSADNNLAQTKLMDCLESVVNKCAVFTNSEFVSPGSQLELVSQDSLKEFVSHSNTELSKVSNSCKKFSAMVSSENEGFEWVDGIVVKAVEEGDWLIIDNVNLCSSSVLDRLNSLLEPDGNILLTEGGTSRIVKPHPSFRVFLVMNPQFGEISRAMRNRCVELAFVDPLDTTAFNPTIRNDTQALDSHLSIVGACSADRMTDWLNTHTSLLGKTFYEQEDFVENLLGQFYENLMRLPNSVLPAHFPKRWMYQRIIKLLSMDILSNPSLQTTPQFVIEEILPHQSKYLVPQLCIHGANPNSTNNVGAVTLKAKQTLSPILFPLFQSSYLPRTVCVALLMIIRYQNHELDRATMPAWWQFLLDTCQPRDKETIDRLLHVSNKLKESSEVTQTQNSFTLRNLAIARLSLAISSCDPWQLPLIRMILISLDDKENHLMKTFAETWKRGYHLAASTPLNILKLLVNKDESIVFMRRLSQSDFLCPVIVFDDKETSIQDGFGTVYLQKDESFLWWSWVKNQIEERCHVIENEIACKEFFEAKDTSSKRSKTGLDKRLNLYEMHAFVVQSDQIDGNKWFKTKEMSLVQGIVSTVSVLDNAVKRMVAIFREMDSRKFITISILIALKHFVVQRDFLSVLLCTCPIISSHEMLDPLELSQKFGRYFPWEGISICIRWIRKGLVMIQKEMDFESMPPIVLEVENNLNHFNSLVGLFWDRQLHDKKIRLWKEGGHAAVPMRQTSWKAIISMRNMITPYYMSWQTSNFVTLFQQFTMVRRTSKQSSLMSEWLGLFATLYWSCTNESFVYPINPNSSANYNKSIHSSNPMIQFDALIPALQAKIDDNNPSRKLDVLPDSTWIEEPERKDLIELLSSKETYDRIEEEYNAFDAEMNSVLAEPLVIQSLNAIYEILHAILLTVGSLARVKTLSESAMEALMKHIHVNQKVLVSLSELCNATITMTIRHTNFPPILLREVQTLLWCIQTLLTYQHHVDGDDEQMRRGYIDNLRRFVKLSLNMTSGSDQRLYTLNANKLSNHVATMDFANESHTMAQLCQRKNTLHTLVITKTDENRLTNTGIVSKFCLGSMLQIVLKHIDTSLMYPSYQGMVTSVHPLRFTVSTTNRLHIKLLRMFRMMVMAMNKNKQIKAKVCSITSHQRDDPILHLVWNTISILRSCRDFFPVELNDKVNAVTTIEDGHLVSDQLCKRFQDYFLDIKLLNIASIVTFRPLQSLFQKALRPLLEILSSPSFYHSKSSDQRIQYGQAFIYIGILRLHLLLPATPIDPAIASRLKATLYSHWIENQTNHFAFEYLNNAWIGEQAVTNSMKASLLQIEKATGRMDHWNGIGIERATEWVMDDSEQQNVKLIEYHDLWHEIRSMMDSLANIETIIDLMNQFVQHREGSVRHPQQQAVLFSTMQELSRQEIHWQLRFFDYFNQFSTNHFHFEDVLSPHFAAFANISNGLRFISFTCFNEVKNTSTLLEYKALHAKDTPLAVTPTSSEFSNAFSIAWRNILSTPSTCIEASKDSSGSSFKDSLVNRINAMVQDGQFLSISHSKSQSNNYWQLLHVLQRMDYLVGGFTLKPQNTYETFKQVMGEFVKAQELYNEERKALALKENALYRNKSIQFGDKDEEAKEREDLLKQFPNHVEELNSALELVVDREANQINGMETASVDSEDGAMIVENPLEDDVSDKVKVNSFSMNSEELSKLDDSVVTSIVGFHTRMVFLYWAEDISKTTIECNCWENTKVLPSRKGKRLMKHKKSRKSNELLQRKYILHQRLWDGVSITAKSFEVGLSNVALVDNQQEIERGSHLAILSTMLKHCSNESESISEPHSIISDFSLNEDSIDRDLLYIMNDHNHHSKFHPHDFHHDPNMIEALKAAGPLRYLANKACDLLQLFPSNEFLLQIHLLSAKIADYHVGTPLGKMLMSLELLLKKGEEWEANAAQFVSIAKELSQVRGLISRWRQIELDSWMNLLRNREMIYVTKALKHWFTLNRLFASGLIHKDVVNSEQLRTTMKWTALQKRYPSWLFDKLSVSQSESQSNTHRQEIFKLLEDFITASNVGEFPTRLHLLRLFALQLQIDANHASRNESNHSAMDPPNAKYQAIINLSNLVFGIWSYYSQFLRTVRQFQDKLKAPIEERLKNEMKMGKWDQLNTYALIEHTEKIHRKLNKFLKEYQQDVLEYPVLSILMKELQGDLMDTHGELSVVNKIPDYQTIFPQINQSSNQEAVQNCMELYLKDCTCRYESLKSIPFDLLPLPSLDISFNRLTKLETLCKKMDSYMKQMVVSTALPISKDDKVQHQPLIGQIGYSFNAAIMAEGICQLIFDRIEVLRLDNTPKQMKYRSIRDLINTFKNEGFSHLRNVLPIEMRNNMSILTVPSPFYLEVATDFESDNLDLPDKTKYSIKETFQKANYYYHRNLVEVTQLRGQFNSQISSDVARNDALQIVGLSENMLFTLIRLRSVLGMAFQDHKDLVCMLNRIDNISKILPSMSWKSAEEMTQSNATAASALLDNAIYLMEIMKTGREALACKVMDDDDDDAFGPSTSLEEANEVINMLDKVTKYLAAMVMVEHDSQLGGVENLSIALPITHQAPSRVSFLNSTGEFTTTDKSAIINGMSHRLHTQVQYFNLASAVLRIDDARADASSSRFVQIASQLGSFDVIQQFMDAYLPFCQKIQLCEDVTVKRSNHEVHLQANFLSSLNRSVDYCLIGVQKLRKFSASNDTSSDLIGSFGESVAAVIDPSDSDVNSDRSLVSSISLGMKIVTDLNIKKLLDELQCIASFDALSEDSIRVIQSCLPLFYRIVNVHSVLINGLNCLMKSLGKLLYVSCRVFRTLFAKGLCVAEVKESNDEAGMDMKFEDNVEGTGMGEGDGRQDVSHEIENEEQLLDLKENRKENEGNKPKQSEKKTLKEEEKDTGVEMSQDFDGEYFDIPEDEKEDDRRKEDSSDDEEKEEEIEREMGEADMEDIVDEKQWVAKDEEEKEKEDQQDEKFERNSNAKGEAVEDEYHTREGEKEEGRKDDGDKEDDKKDGKKEGKKDEKQKGDDDEEENDEKGKINEDNEEKYMEKQRGIDVREGKEPVLPDDDDEGVKQEEGDEEQPEDEVEGNQGEGAEKEKESSKPDGQKAEGDAKQQEAREDDVMESEETADDQEGVKNEDEDDAIPDDINMDGGEKDDSQEMMNDDQTEDDENISKGDGMDLTNEAEEKDDEDPNNQLKEECEEGVNPDTERQDPMEENRNNRPKNNESSKIPTHGVHTRGGEDAILGQANDPSQLDHSKQSDVDRNMNDSSSGQGDVSEGRSDSAYQRNTSSRGEEDSMKNGMKDDIPNPFKEPGDVNKKWHRRLNVIQSSDSEEKTTDIADLERKEEDRSDENMKGKGVFEHSAGDEGEGNCGQVLADSNEKEAIRLPLKEEEEESVNGPQSGEDNESEVNNRMEEEKKEYKRFDNREERKRNRSSSKIGSNPDDEEHRRNDEVEEEKTERKRNKQDSNPQWVDNDRNEEEDEGGELHDDEEMSLDETSRNDEETEKKGKDREKDSDIRSMEVETSDQKKSIFTKDRHRFGRQSLNEEKLDEISVLPAASVKSSFPDNDQFLRFREMWSMYRMQTESFSIQLCEQLRVILEPTLATRLQGDYRTGKRINMRKIIPYIASGFRKDKIWLRRTKPAKRDYQVMIMIDNSQSMSEAGPLAISALSVMAHALNRLEVGDLSIVAFSDKLEMIHDFGSPPLNDEVGAKIISKLTFEADQTLLGSSLQSIIPIMERSKSLHMSSTTAASSNAIVLQLCFVISDARIDNDNRIHLDNIIRTMSEQHILVVLIILDQNSDPKDSIFNTKSVAFVGNKVITTSYFDDFPFPYYLAIQQLEHLPNVLADALKQWFTMIRTQLMES